MAEEMNTRWSLAQETNVAASGGALIRELTLDPSRDYQPRRATTRTTQENRSDAGMFQDTCQRCPQTSHGRADRI